MKWDVGVSIGSPTPVAHPSCNWRITLLPPLHSTSKSGVPKMGDPQNHWFQYQDGLRWFGAKPILGHLQIRWSQPLTIPGMNRTIAAIRQQGPLEAFRRSQLAPWSACESSGLSMCSWAWPERFHHGGAHILTSGVQMPCLSIKRYKRYKSHLKCTKYGSSLTFGAWFWGVKSLRNGPDPQVQFRIRFM